jgi:PAS domain S-box-containing protein
MMSRDTKGTILVVDDSLTSLKLLNSILSELGYTIYTANSGALALSSVVSVLPDLILLDLQLSGMDGFEVCEKLKKMEKVKDIPVIFLSGLANSDYKVKGFELGAVDFISKPFQQAELLLRIQTHIQMHKMQLELKRQAGELNSYNLQLERSERKFRSIVESSPMGMYFYKLQPDGKLVFDGANPAADKIIGTDHHKYIGKTIQEAFPNLANTNVLEMYSKVATGELNTQQFEIEYHDEQQINGVFSVTVFQSGENFVTVQFIDISEQKNAELALKVSEERFRHVFEHSPIGMSMTGVDGTLRANNAFCEMVGYTEEELQGKSWKEITHPDDIQESIDVINRLNYYKEGVEFEKRYIHKNGSVVYANVYSVVQCNGDDIPMFYITTVVNITRRKLAEEKLRRSEEELKKAQHITHIGSWYLDMVTNEVVWTEELYRMYGFDPTLPPPPYTEHKKLFTTESWELLSTSLAQTAVTGIPYELELKTIKKDGGNGWMWVRGETIQDAKGITIGLWGAAQDISDRKMNELLLLQKNDEILAQNEEFQQLNEELDQTNYELIRAKLNAEESEIRYHTVVSNTPLVTFVLNAKGIFTLSEGKGLAKLGLKPGQVVGLSSFDVYKDYPAVVQDIKQALTGKNLRSESALPGVVFDVIYTPVLDNQGNVIEVIGVAYDITERKFAEEELIKAKEKAEQGEILLTESQRVARLGSYVWDLSTNRWESSKILDEIFGIDENYIRSLEGWSAIVHPSWQNIMEEYIANEVLEKHLRFDKEYKIVRQNDGVERWVYGMGELEFDNNHLPTKLIGTIQDITEKVKAEESIKTEQKLLRTLIENLPDAVYIKDANARKVITNAADLKFLDAESESAIIGKTDLELFSGAIGARGYNDDMEVLTTGKPVINKEEYFQLANGEQHWLLTSKIPFSNSKDEISGLVGIGRDITELKKSNEAIIKLSKAIEQSPLSIVITNTKGEIEYTNPKFTEITGYSSIEVKGKNPRILKSGETSDEEYKALWTSISKGDEWHGVLHNRKKNGELYWESASISPIVNEKGEIINYIAIKEDISIQKELLEELVVSKEKAEESDRLKSAFLANMSHEIRTPLNGILGFTELLIDPDFNEEQKADMARLVLDNGDQLLSIINDVLDISKIESGQIELKYSVFSVKQMINDIKKSFEHRAQVNKIDLRLAMDIPVEEIDLKSDFTKIKQVLSNLLSNALKYTDNGFVEIGFRATEKELIFHVKDSGVGIPAEFREKIFDRFRHLEPNRSKLAGGNGLGLSISKSFIEMMGGRIWVDSEVGKGSCFYFTVPNIV